MSKHATALQAIDRLKEFQDAVYAAQSAMHGALDSPPPGYCTVAEYAECRQITPQSACTALNKLVSRGKLTRVKVFALGDNGRRLAVWHYGPKK